MRDFDRCELKTFELVLSLTQQSCATEEWEYSSREKAEGQKGEFWFVANPRAQSTIFRLAEIERERDSPFHFNFLFKSFV